MIFCYGNNGKNRWYNNDCGSLAGEKKKKEREKKEGGREREIERKGGREKEKELTHKYRSSKPHLDIAVCAALMLSLRLHLQIQALLQITT